MMNSADPTSNFHGTMGFPSMTTNQAFTASNFGNMDFDLPSAMGGYNNDLEPFMPGVDMIADFNSHVDHPADPSPRLPAFDNFALPRGQKRQRENGTLPRTSARPDDDQSLPRSMDLVSYANGIAACHQSPLLTEPDYLILATERTLERLDSDDPDDVAHELARTWSQSVVWAGDDSGEIGPPPNASPLEKAQYISSLLLALNHRNVKESMHRPMAARGGRGSISRLDRPPSTARILLDWLNQYHDIWMAQTIGLSNLDIGYSAHPEFWDILNSAALRGKFDLFVKLLQGANFAVSMQTGSTSPSNYSHGELGLIDDVIDETVRLFDNCPAVMSDNWEIQGDEWIFFRHQIHNLNKKIRVLSLHGIDKGATLLPKDFGEGLSNILNALECFPDEVQCQSNDWLEATVLLAVWWNGESETDFRPAASVSRRQAGPGPGERTHVRSGSFNSSRAIQLRLIHAFAFCCDVHDFPTDQPFNPTDPIHVAVSCALVGEVESAIKVVRTFSLLLASALTELGIKSGWLADPKSGAQAMLNNFSPQDLAVLNYNNDQEGLTRPSFHDELLQELGTQLFERPSIEHVDGWQVGLQVMSRLTDQNLAADQIGKMLDQVDTTGPGRLDGLLAVCNRLGRVEYGRRVAERHADAMMASRQHGVALLYYARAGKADKVRDLLDLLCCQCLIQSKEYPLASAMDPKLKEFIDTPQTALNQLCRVDYEAAQILSDSLSGYATIRLFYRLRDAEVDREGGTTGGPAMPRGRKLGRLREAGSSLLASISSAADSIKDGLYDSSVESVVNIDCLLALLGEALVFVSQPRRLLTCDQLLSLVRVIEDLETVSPVVFRRCNDLLMVALRNYINPKAAPVVPSSTVAKSDPTDGISKFRPGASVFFQRPEFGHFDPSSNDSGGGVTIRRAWDWRRGLIEQTRGSSGGGGVMSEPGVDGHDVVSVLRVLLAREVSKAWIEEAAVPVRLGPASGMAVARRVSYEDGEGEGEDEGVIIEQKRADGAVSDGDVFMSRPGPGPRPGMNLFAGV